MLDKQLFINVFNNTCGAVEAAKLAAVCSWKCPCSHVEAVTTDAVATRHNIAILKLTLKLTQ